MTARSEDNRLLVAYQVLGARRLGYDQMAWQTPALSFTAQAFLFSIALGVGASQASRLISAALALVVSVVSVQLLRKHHHMELVDSVLLEKIETKLGLPQQAGAHSAFHSPAKQRRVGLLREDGVPIRGDVLVDQHAPLWWTAALSLFAVAALVVIGLTLFYDSALP